MNKKFINIWKIPIILKQKIRWIAASTLGCGLLMLFISTVLIKAQYTAEVSLYIYSSTVRTESESSEITSSELSASQLLVDTYAVILESNTVLNKVIEQLELDCSAKDLRENISADAVNNTEVLSISVSDTEPERAQQIANTIAEVLPEELVRVVKAGGVEVVDYAEVPENPSSPNVVLNVAAGILFGLFLSCGIIILMDYFNTKIKGEEDLQEYFDMEIPVLGVIPMLTAAKENHYEEK